MIDLGNVILRDLPAKSLDTNYWIGRNRLRSEFNLSAKEADEEPYDEALIHFRIWKLQADRQEVEQRRAEFKAKNNRT
jgi:hypothetical protein